jgi:hypothetical protein
MTLAARKRNAAAGVGTPAARNRDAAGRNCETLWLGIGTLQRELEPLPHGVGTPLHGIRYQLKLCIFKVERREDKE